MVARRWVDDACVDRFVPEHDLADELPEDTRTESAVQVTYVADEEIESHRGAHVLDTPRSRLNRVELNVADRYFIQAEEIGYNVCRSGHSRKVLRAHVFQ